MASHSVLVNKMEVYLMDKDYRKTGLSIYFLFKNASHANV